MRHEMRGVRPEAYELSHPGLQRPHNEDSVGSFEPQDPNVLRQRGRLYVVADGLGGHAAGEVASEYAVEQVLYAYYHEDWHGPTETLTRAIELANADLYDEATHNPERKGMGTTIVAAVIQDDALVVANVGDSRAYLLRDGELHQITQDHTWVAEQLDRGELTPEQVKNHPNRNVITRSLGYEPEVDVDIFEHDLRAGDTIILCTDGLHGEVDDGAIADIVAGTDPRSAARRLIDRANEQGGADNITVSIIEARAPADARPTPLRTDAPAPSRGRRYWIAAVVAVFVAASVFLARDFLFGVGRAPPAGTPVGTQTTQSAGLSVATKTVTVFPSATSTETPTPAPVTITAGVPASPSASD